MVAQICNPDSWEAEEEFKASLGYIVKLFFQKQSKTTTKKEIMGAVDVSW